MLRLTFAVAASLLLATTLARADGPGAYRPRSSGPAPLSAQGAIDAYTAGYASILHAEHAENLAAAATSDVERKAARRDADRAYETALENLATAVRLDASMHEAYTYMGYANRRLGRYELALQAYEQALAIEPELPRAIEYQGEAYLALNRIDEARFNYLRLYALDQRQAGKLLLAMRAWAEANRHKPPAGVDFDAFDAWLAEKIASTKLDTSDAARSIW